MMMFILTIVRYEDLALNPVRTCEFVASFLYNGHQPDELKFFMDKNYSNLPFVDDKNFTHPVNIIEVCVVMLILVIYFI